MTISFKRHVMHQTIHSYSKFHEAGHGTFFSSQFDNGSKRFLLVYDCGSRRSSRMPALSRDLQDHYAGNLINLLCVSHFDADHVNGLVHLLENFRVDTLALPYLPLVKRLKVVCEFDSKKKENVDVALFTLDPVEYLRRRVGQDRIARIVFVRGGAEPAPPPSEARYPEGEDGPPRGNDRSDDKGIKSDLYWDSEELGTGSDGPYATLNLKGLPANISARLLTIDHSKLATLFEGLWEFVFYNTALPDDITPESGASLTDVRLEISKILEEHCLFSTGSTAVPGWRKKLRECYDKHFGSDGPERNNISLCLLSRPVTNASTRIDECKWFDPAKSELGTGSNIITSPRPEKCGLLLTGDISLDSDETRRMEFHFLKSRWETIFVMQVPHHGSEKSWVKGTAKNCYHEHSVACVPDSDKDGHHPHDNVLDDLIGRNFIRANYSASVIFAFHVGWGRKIQIPKSPHVAIAATP